MEFEFDKEIDALLRQAARGGDAVSTDAHMDADEISAFAENALPEKTKNRYTMHLADCARCRKILSNLIFLESETVSETVSSVVKEKDIVKANIPWYRKIFAMPNLAYTMGALVLLFSGLIGFIFLQSTNNSLNSEVSVVTDKSMDSKSTSSAPSASNANMSMNTNAAANSASVNSSNSTTIAVNRPANIPLPTSVPNMAETPNIPENTKVGDSRNLANPVPKDEPSRESDKELAKTKAAESVEIEDSTARKTPTEENKPINNRNRADDADEVTQQPKNAVSIPPLASSGAGATSTDQKEKKTASKKADTTSSGGKTFRRSNNVWYDASYSGQSTTNITRGTAEYKKLDSGLREIVENLGGTVVIVWKSKAYRIQ